MKGYRRYGLSYVEVTIPLDSRGTPILFEDTTIESPPADREGYNKTIQNSKWVFIDKTSAPRRATIEEVRRKKLEAFERWKNAYVDSPSEMDGVVYHNDEQSRGRAVGAVVHFREHGKLPPAWKAMGNVIVTPITGEFILALADMLSSKFQDKFYAAGTIEAMIHAVQTVEAIQGIVFPEIPTYESIKKEILERELKGKYDKPKPSNVSPLAKRDPVDPFVEGVVADTVNGVDALSINLETINPGLPLGSDTYDKGLKKVYTNESDRDVTLVYELIQPHEFYDEKRVVSLDQVVSNDGVDASDLKRYLPGEKIEVKLTKGDTLWLGFVMGRPAKNRPENVITRDDLFEDLTYAGGVYRVVVKK